MAKEAVIVNAASQKTFAVLAALVVGTLVAGSTLKHANSSGAPHVGRAVQIGSTSRWYAHALDLSVSGE